MRSRSQRRVLAAALVAALLVAAHPPWRATAVRTSTRHAGVPNVEPVTLVDTIEWTLAFAPLYARPRSPSDPTLARQVDERARRERQAAIERFEHKYKVPEILRTAGAAWRDSILGRAGIPSASSYAARFAVDRARLALRLAVVALLGAASYYWMSRRRGREEDWDQEDAFPGI